jgi:hypothetical protein
MIQGINFILTGDINNYEKTEDFLQHFDKFIEPAFATVNLTSLYKIQSINMVVPVLESVTLDKLDKLASYSYNVCTSLMCYVYSFLGITNKLLSEVLPEMERDFFFSCGNYFFFAFLQTFCKELQSITKGQQSDVVNLVREIIQNFKMKHVVIKKILLKDQIK